MSAAAAGAAPAPSLDGRRVLLLFPSLRMGGAERQALAWARHLRREAGGDVTAWALAQEGPVRALLEAEGIPVELHPTRRPHRNLSTLLHHRRLVRRMRRLRPEALVAFTYVPNLVAGLLWRRAGARTCLWNQRDEGLHLKGVALERRALASVPVIVSNSRAGADFLVARLGADPARIHVVPNGVERLPARISGPAWRARLGAAADTPIATMVANLHRYKDHETLLRAWSAAIPGLAPAPLLVLAGAHGDRHVALVALARELGIEERVRFPGAVDDVGGLLAASDLSVFSSRSEGLPNGVLEAMAAGLATAATDLPGIREAVGESGLPFLAPPGDAGALARAIRTLLADRALRERVGAAQRARAEREFALDVMCRRMSDLLRAGLAGGEA